MFSSGVYVKDVVLGVDNYVAIIIFRYLFSTAQDNQDIKSCLQDCVATSLLPQQCMEYRVPPSYMLDFTETRKT